MAMTMRIDKPGPYEPTSMANDEQADERGSFVDSFGIFVIKSSDPADGYRWEVRKGDGIVLERSIETFRTMLLARYARSASNRGRLTPLRFEPTRCQVPSAKTAATRAAPYKPDHPTRENEAAPHETPATKLSQRAR